MYILVIVFVFSTFSFGHGVANAITKQHRHKTTIQSIIDLLVFYNPSLSDSIKTSIVFSLGQYLAGNKGNNKMFTPGFKWGSCYSIFSFICIFWWSFLYFLLFLLAMELSLLLYADYNYPFGIFQLFEMQFCLVYSLSV
jgi:hypothetical protein